MTAILLSALAAGLVAMTVTRLIEHFGGVLGGLLATLPTTIVPAAAGILAASPAPAEFRDAMGAVPVGMAVDGLFLFAWRVLPPRLPGTPEVRLAGTTAIALGIWALTAASAALAMDALGRAGVAPILVGAVAFFALEAGGIWACRHAVPAPKGTRTVGSGTLAARGVLAAVAIGISAALALQGSPLLAGMASVFPAIFLTTMVSLWWSQGEAVPVGAVGPMILGSGAVSAYALAAAFLLPAWGMVLGSIGAWMVAASCVTVPAWWWLRSRAEGEPESA